MKRLVLTLLLLIPYLGCGPSPEKLFERSLQTDSLPERKALREELLKKYPEHPYGLFAKAYLLGANGEKDHFLQQLEIYTQVIKMQPNLAVAYVNRGIIREELNLKTDAMADYTKAIEIDPNLSHAYFKRGRLKIKLNETKAALVDLGMAIQLKPRESIAYVVRGKLYGKQKKYSEALADMNVALEINKDDTRALFERGIIKYHLKDYQGAKEDYTKVKDSDSDLKALAELNIGLILKEEGAPRTEYCLYFGNAYQRDRKLAEPYYKGNCF